MHFAGFFGKVGAHIVTVAFHQLADVGEHLGCFGHRVFPGIVTTFAADRPGGNVRCHGRAFNRGIAAQRAGHLPGLFLGIETVGAGKPRFEYVVVATADIVQNHRKPYSSGLVTMGT